MTQNHAAVLKAIQEVCPELMELSFGCEATTREPLSNIEAKAFPIPFGHWIILERRQCFNQDAYVRMIKKDAIWTGNSVEISRETFNGIMIILGHPIRLSHVLRAIEKQPGMSLLDFALDSDGWFIQRPKGSHRFCQVVRYDLTQDDLSLQSPETIDFLFNILCE